MSKVRLWYARVKLEQPDERNQLDRPGAFFDPLEYALVFTQRGDERDELVEYMRKTSERIRDRAQDLADCVIPDELEE